MLAWCTGNGKHLANNTIRSRLSRVCTFLRFCVRVDEADPALVEALLSRDNPLRHMPRLYGKLQGTYPPRYLTHERAYGQLLGTCTDGELGLRDELLLRLGLAGMRVSEIIHLRMRDLRLTDDPPMVTWIGKANRARRIMLGQTTVACMRRYLDLYAERLGRSPQDDDVVICRGKTGGGIGQISFGHGIAQPCSVQEIVRRRANQA
ncbi:MAG: tyrosine-type recombinase/integrase [Acidimicrobiales bacterium]